MTAPPLARKPETLVVHPRREEGHGPLAFPVYQTSTWRVADAAQGARFAEETHPSAFYHRWGNPTVELLEETLAQLEGGAAALCTGSGMGAISTAILTALGGAHHVASQRAVYTATNELLTVMMPDFGVRHTFWNPSEPGSLKAAITPDTKLVYIETPANPTMEITDIRAAAQAAHEAGALCIADNTFATPLNQRPLALGCDAVVHSMTKFIGGHSDLTGGAIVGSRDFLGKCWFNFKILGPTLSPHDAFLAQRGIKTMALRVERHNRNAQALAEFLEGHVKVERVHYPGLKSHPGHGLAAKQMSGFGGMLSFDVKGGFAAAKRVAEGVRLATLAVSLGGVETLVQHAASMTHGPLTDADRARAGIREGLLRVSVGIEHIDDILADFQQALARA
ncbi:MAG TPA: aminotransferase class I/II-fold pyridoxal phosphate-dependent enzyme [Candidatus Thermoplasmatota archaeon]|nr:aminotransferase class I/II-fold pyridoxal phosphate-dependent enzyme [Candidatus Thermoplasmatota archaeon]